jgi:23S rRNA pseudouridine1911/1915/1917 synthase
MYQPFILFEDNHLIAVNKLPGEITQGDKTGDVPLTDNLKEYLKHTYQKPGNVFVGLIHRIDRPVSGVVLLAKTSKGLARMNEQFKQRETEKTYWALVQGAPAETEATLTHYLKRNTNTNVTTAFDRPGNGAQEATLSYKVLQSNGKFSLLEVKPITGRTHQIRAQLSKIGCSIKGDKKYRSMYGTPDRSICLHARQLSFIHPITKQHITIEAPVTNPHVWEGFV